MLGINLRKPHSAVDLPPQMSPSLGRWPLSMPLLQFSPLDTWTLSHACMGTQIMGGTGSGKSSSSGRAIALAMLRAGFGGIVLCAKPGEKDTWIDYAKQTGRLSSVVVFDGSGREKFNFLDYELRRMERFEAGNLVALFNRIMEAAGGTAGNAAEQTGPWKALSSELISNIFIALHAAHGSVKLADMMEMLDSAPKTLAQPVNADWQASSYCHKTLVKMATKPVNAIDDHDANAVAKFFYQRWPSREGKIRSSIEATLSAGCYGFLTGTMRKVFCETTTIIPEMTHEGALIILDFPIKTFHEAGTLAQHIFKYCWQRAAETRKRVTDRTRPIFCFADECQFFLSEYDSEFQSTARSSRACTVYITQGISSLYKAMGGNNSKEAVDSLLQNFQTKIFHQNTNSATNEYAATIIGQQWLDMTSNSTNTGGNSGDSDGRNKSWTLGIGAGFDTDRSGGKNWTRSKGRNWGSSTSWSKQLGNEVLASTFNELRIGGPPEAIIIQGGRRFHQSGRFYLRCAIRQSGG